MDSRAPGRELPLWLWLVFPPLILIAQLAAKASSEELFLTWMHGEIGAVELGTVLFLVIAVGAGVALLLRRPRPDLPLFAPWILVITLGSLYFGGEEASWGQHYFGWSTPEAWAAINRQQETNLHNTFGLLDQVPRAGLTIGVLIGGVLLPLWILRRGRASAIARHPLAWTIPTVVVVPTAILASVVTLPHKLYELAGREVPNVLEIAPGESKEYYFALFLMLYLLSLHRRLPAPGRPSAPAHREPVGAARG